MTSRIRFNTARQVFEAFPMAAKAVATTPGDEAPLDFGRKLLLSAKRFEAVAFLAFLLPRREAVWWGCQCWRAIRQSGEDEALLAAEAWVREPEEERRREALALAKRGDNRVASTWLARAAGQSGGNVAPDGRSTIAAPPHMTGVAVKSAVVLTIASAPADEHAAWLSACVEAGLRFADGGDAKVRLTTPFARTA